VEEIGESCKRDIAGLRSITVTEELFRELWVRGPDRHWYRYLVLPESVEAMVSWDEPEDGEETGTRLKPDETTEPVKHDGTGNGETPKTVIKPEDKDEPDDRACGADTRNSSGSLQAVTAGPV